MEYARYSRSKCHWEKSVRVRSIESKKETRGHASGTGRVLIFLQLAKNIYSEFLSNKLHKIPLSVTSKDRRTIYARINNLMFVFPSFRYERSFVNKVGIKIHFSLRRKNSIGRSEIYQRITIYQNIFLPSRISSRIIDREVEEINTPKSSTTGRPSSSM